MTHRERLVELRNYIESKSEPIAEKDHKHLGKLIYYKDGEDYFNFEIRDYAQVCLMSGQIRVGQKFDSDNFTFNIDRFIIMVRHLFNKSRQKTEWR